MSYLFLLICLLGVPALVIGMLRPRTFGGGRGRALLISLLMMFGGLVGIGVTHEAAVTDQASPAHEPAPDSVARPLTPEISPRVSPVPETPAVAPASSVAPPAPAAPSVASPAPVAVSPRVAGEAADTKARPPGPGLRMRIADLAGRFNDAAARLKLPVRAVETRCDHGNAVSVCLYKIGQTIAGLAAAKPDRVTLDHVTLILGGDDPSRGPREMMQAMETMIMVFEPNTDAPLRLTTFAALLPDDMKQAGRSAQARVGSTRITANNLGAAGLHVTFRRAD